MSDYVYLNQKITSIPCMACLPEGNWYKGIKGDWYVDKDKGKAWCTNCHSERPYHVRVIDKSKPTKKQEGTIKRIEVWFRETFGIGSDEDFYRFEVKHDQEVGLTYLYVETVENIWAMNGAYFSIGPRGKIEVFGTASLYHWTKERYAACLDGHVS